MKNMNFGTVKMLLGSELEDLLSLGVLEQGHGKESGK